jgi:RNA polymerase sigma factor (sigma-70 family)
LNGIGLLNEEQKKLVENNLDIVERTIKNHITILENIYGFSYDDLFQEGSIILCKAAVTYNGELAQFDTYALVVVKNGLLTYCKKMWKKHKYVVSLNDMSDLENESDTFPNDYVEDKYNSIISDLNIFDMFESIKFEYDGITRLGIEALELKVKGFTGAEIAKLWGVKQNHVGAWITRAKRKLYQNEKFMSALKIV